jgi:hypothetical protein
MSCTPTVTSADARSMATSGRGTGMVGYNVQTALLARRFNLASLRVCAKPTRDAKVHLMDAHCIDYAV